MDETRDLTNNIYTIIKENNEPNYFGSFFLDSTMHFPPPFFAPYSPASDDDEEQEPRYYRHVFCEQM